MNFCNGLSFSYSKIIYFKYYIIILNAITYELLIFKNFPNTKAIQSLSLSVKS